MELDQWMFRVLNSSRGNSVDLFVTKKWREVHFMIVTPSFVED